MENNKKGLSLVILGVSLFQMGMVGLAPIVAAVTQAFPGTSEVVAQTSMTFLNLVLVIVALFGGVISSKIGRKAMTALGMLFTALGGFGGLFFSFNIVFTYIWSAFLGVGTGLFVPAAASMMVDYFEPEERNRIAGLQTASVNLGGVVISFFAGILAGIHWNYAYMLFLLAIPVFFICLKYGPTGPKEKVKADGGKQKIPFSVWEAAVKSCIFALLYFTFSTNISLLLVEKGKDATTLAGVGSACFMLGGALIGMLFGKIYGKFGNRTAALAFFMVAFSDIVIFSTDNLVLLFAIAFIGGGSLSVIFPYFLVSVAGKVDPAVSVISTSLILSVGPNFGSFISPTIVTNLSNMLLGTQVNNRFLLVSIIALILGVIFWITDGRKKEA